MLATTARLDPLTPSQIIDDTPTNEYTINEKVNLFEQLLEQTIHPRENNAITFNQNALLGGQGDSADKTLYLLERFREMVIENKGLNAKEWGGDQRIADTFKEISEEYKKMYGNQVDPDFFKEKYFEVFYRFQTKQEHLKRVNEKVAEFLVQDEKPIFLSDFLGGEMKKRYKKPKLNLKKRFGLNWQFDQLGENLRKQNNMFQMGVSFN